MQTHTKDWQFARRATIAGLIILTYLAFLSSARAAESLFSSSPVRLTRQSIAAQSVAPGYLRTRLVQINPPMLKVDSPLRRQSVAIAADEPAMVLNLFDDRQHDVVITKTKSSGTSDFVAVGKVAGAPESLVILSVRDGIMSGSISMPDQNTTTISYAGNGYHMVGEVDPQSIPPCAAGGTPLPLPAEGELPPTAGDVPTRIDVMVVYTAAARSGAGGTSAIQSLIGLAVAEANETYGNSEINIELNLVYQGEVTYTETGVANTDLSRLQTSSDGHLDAVHTLRSQYGADVVIMLTENMSTYAGLAYVMSPPSSGFAGYAFGVVKRQYATGSYVFAHEVGHLFGCQHDRDNASSAGAYSYSYGHRFDGTNAVQYRTVMAYTPGTRIPYFSNPNINYQGTATGVASGATAADNALSVNTAAPTIAAFAGESTSISFELTSTNITETNVTLTFTLLREGATNVTSTVQYSTSGTSATAGSDYTALTGNVSFDPGDTNKSINLSILNDSAVESSEVVRVTLSNPTNAVLGIQKTVDVTIEDDDIGITFAAATASVTEDGTNVTVTVKRTGDTAPTVTVDYATADLSAAAGSDYASTNGSLSFGAGETNLTITVPITADSSVETNETFKITLSNAAGGTLVSPSETIVTILEDDSTISFLTNAVFVSESATNVTLTLRRTGGTNSSSTVEYLTEDDTATAGGDYTSATGTVTFAAGIVTQTINVPLTNDSSIEGSEGFGVILSNLVGATFGAHTNAVVTINDNDSSFEFSESSAAVKENARSVTITVLRTGGSVGTASVKYSTSNETATAGTDFTARTGTLSFAAGETNKSFTVTLRADTTFETNEVFNVVLSEPAGEATVGSVTNIAVTIQDHISFLAFETNTVSVAEDGTSVTINVLRTGQLAFTNTVPFTFTAGTAKAGDYTATNGTLIFAANSTNAAITVGILNDSQVESTETFTVKLGTPSNAGQISGTNTAVISIAEDDVGLAFTATALSVSEAGTNITLTVLQTGDTNATVSVDYLTSDLLAEAGSDYTAANGTLNFGAGTNSLSIVVPVTDDSSIESNETFRVSLTNATGAILLAASNSVVTILEEDSVLSLSTNAISASENTGSVTLTVWRTGGTNFTSSVDYATADGTATNAVDFIGTNATLTFGPGVKSQIITVALLNDSSVDGEKNFSVGLTNATGSVLGSVTNTTVTIKDNDSIIQFSTNAVTSAETAGSVSFAILRSGGLIGPATVRYATSNETATAGTDYTAKSGLISFAAGETNKTVIITLRNDTTSETNEIFNIVLSSPTSEAALGTNDSVAVTLTDNDSLLAFETNLVAVAENAGTVSLNVRRTGTLDYTNTISYSVVASSAGTSDYTATNGTLTFAPNSTNATITINITNDSVIETNEIFTVRIANPAGGALISGTNAAQVTITENDVGLAFTSATYSVAESGTNVTLTVVQTGNTNSSASVDYTTSDLIAAAGSDYTATNGTLAFGAGTNSLTIVVPVAADSTLESNETFRVSLTNATGAILLTASNAVVSILEDDATVQLSTNTVTVAENGASATLTVLRTGGTNSTVTVEYFTTAGTATNAVDFTSTNGTLSIAPGLTSKTITVPLLNDSAVDGEKTFTLSLTNASGANLGSGTNATVTIQDNDSTFEFTTNSVTAAETSSAASVTIARAGGVISSATVRYATADSTATAGSDYTAKSGMLTFSAGETNKVLSFVLRNDTTTETNEVFNITLSSPTGEATLGSNSTVAVTINDNDSLLAFETNVVAFAENAGTATLNIRRTGTLTGTNTLRYTIRAGSAGTSDYSATNGVLTFAPNATNAAITIALTNDSLVETNESFTVQISSPAGGALINGTNTAYVTITENDIGLAFTPAAYSVNESETNVTLTIVQTGDTNGVATVDFLTTDVTAEDGSDYTATNGTLAFGPGTNTLTITVPLTVDTTIESNETFRVSLTNPTGAILLAASNAVVTLLENDASLELSTNALSVNENTATATLTVLRIGGTNSSVTVDYFTTAGTGTNAVDFTATNATLTFGPGEKTKSIIVALLNDSDVDGAKTFTLSLTNASGADLGSTTNATVTINDNDSVIQFSTNAVSVAETGASVTLTAVRTGGLIGPATVRYATTNDSATAGTDFTTKSGVLSFAAGETNKAVSITIRNDTTYETNEIFNVVLSNPTGEGTVGPTSSVAVTITDNDSLLAFETNAVTVAENGGAVSLNVRRTGTLTTTNTLRYTVRTGTARTADYSATNGTLTFAPNATNATITLNITDDSLVESTESFSVQIASPAGGALISGTNTATITITENDAGLAFSAASYSVVEDATNVTLTIVQTGNTNATATVDYAMTDLGATDGADYTATNGTLAFGAGTNSLTITIPVLDDSALETNETFRVSLTNVSGAILLANSNALVRILEDDSALAFTTNAVSVLENLTSVTLTIARSGGTNFEATVDLLSADGTATDGGDYTATNATLTFSPGIAKKTVTVLLSNDSDVEGDESFSLSLTNITGAELGAHTNLTVTVLDNDSVIGLSTNAASVSESAGTTILTLRRTGGIVAVASVRYATANGTATAGADYRSKTGTIRFAAGETNKTIALSILNDTAVDADETFTLTLTSPTGEAAIGTNATTVTIVDNDFATGGQVVEGDLGIFITALGWNANGCPIIEVEGPLGAAVNVQASSDLRTWEDVAQGLLSGVPFECTDAGGSGKALRFYRVLQPAPAADDAEEQ